MGLLEKERKLRQLELDRLECITNSIVIIDLICVLKAMNYARRKEIIYYMNKVYRKLDMPEKYKDIRKPKKLFYIIKAIGKNKFLLDNRFNDIDKIIEYNLINLLSKNDYKTVDDITKLLELIDKYNSEENMIDIGKYALLYSISIGMGSLYTSLMEKNPSISSLESIRNILLQNHNNIKALEVLIKNIKFDIDLIKIYDRCKEKSFKLDPNLYGEKIVLYRSNKFIVCNNSLIMIVKTPSRYKILFDNKKFVYISERTAYELLIKLTDI